MKFFNLNSRAWILIIGVSMAMVGAVLAQSGMQSPMMPRQMMMIGSEFDYLSQMMPHHEEAVVTAKQILAGSKRKQMQIFAAKIIKVQSAEINKMREWTVQWYPKQISTFMYQPMMRDLSKLSGDAFDQVFLEDMIMHHYMAVMMSQQLIMHGNATHKEVNVFAKTVRDTQMQEIRTMQSWLSNWFGVNR